MVKRFTQGINDYGEPFAQSILKDYDSNVSLLSHPTTLDLFRKELYLPFIVDGFQVINRETRDLWKLSGEMSARQRAKEIAIKLSERSPKHPIDDTLKKELDRIAKNNLK